MSALIPDGTESILASIEDLLATTSVPLNEVSEILDSSKDLLTESAPFDFLGTLEDTINDFKSTYFPEGLFVCHMWDYPVRQLHDNVGDTSSLGNEPFGPDNTFDTINLDGHEFADSFLYDLDASFDDLEDIRKPNFIGDVSMLLLVKADSDIGSLGITGEENNSGEAFKGIDDVIAAAGRSVRLTRYRGMLGKLKKTAQSQPAGKVSIRVERIEAALQTLSSLSDEALDAVQFPEDEDAGTEFFEGDDAENIPWFDAAVPFLESLEDQGVASSYPDWSNVYLADVHLDLVDLVNNVLDPVVDLLQSGQDIKQSIIDMIDAIQSKIEALEELIDNIALINDEFDLLTSITGFNALYISSSKGITGLREQLASAGSPYEGKAFYSGMVLLAGDESKTAFDSLFAGVGNS